MGFGSGIRDPGSGKPISDPGSRGQKGTGSGYQIPDPDPQHWSQRIGKSIQVLFFYYCKGVGIGYHV